MKYLVGLAVFSGIASFLISDTIDFWRELRKKNSQSQLGVDFLRLVVLAGMAGIGYWTAKESFQKPSDGIVFLVIGIIAAFSTHIISSKLRR
jgi:F0F1-type ATP synthase assembly protein I